MAKPGWDRFASRGVKLRRERRHDVSRLWISRDEQVRALAEAEALLEHIGPMFVTRAKVRPVMRLRGAERGRVVL